jgi:hypothetical protein
MSLLNPKQRGSNPKDSHNQAPDKLHIKFYLQALPMVLADLKYRKSSR